MPAFALEKNHGPVLAVDLDALHEVAHGGQGGDLRLALAGASV